MAVMPFSTRQIDVLRQLTHLWTPERFVLIGAAALGCFLDMRWRGTADLDLTLAISLEEFLDENLVPGWRRDQRMEHRWYASARLSTSFRPGLSFFGQVWWSGREQVTG